MSDFLRDTFAVSGPLALESHTPDVGGAWSTAQTAGSVIITTSSHECRPLAPTNPTDANHYYINAATPPSADYTAVATFNNHESGGVIGDKFRLAWRYVDDTHHYFVEAADDGTFILWKKIGTTFTNLVSGSSSALTAGQTLTLSGGSVGSTHTAIFNGTTISATDSDAALTGAGKVGFTWNANAGWTDTNKLNISQIRAYTGGNSYTLTTAPGAFVETGNAATLTKSGQRVLTTSPGAFALTGIAATLTKSGGGTTTIAVTDINIYWSPYNWYAGSGFKQTSCHGAYFKLALTGTTTLKLNVDLSALNAISGIITTGYPELIYRVGTGPLTTGQLTSGNTIPINLSGLSGTTQLECWLKSINHNYDAYTVGANSVKITSFTVDTGGSTTTLTGDFAVKPKTMVAFGNSIICAFYVYGLADDRNTDSTISYIRAIAQSLNAEVGVIAIPGQGLDVPGNMGFPACYNSTDGTNQSYQFHYSGLSRLSAGVLAGPTPNYCWLQHGENDTAGSAFQTSYAAFIGVLRTICGGSTQIIAQVPVGGFCRSQILGAIATAADINLVTRDAGTTAQIGCDNTSGGTATEKTNDGIHLNSRGHVEMSARLGSGSSNSYYLYL